MGKTRTPKYRLEIRHSGKTGYKPMIWEGRATDKRLERWIGDFIQSLKIGGVNEHLTKALGYMPIPNDARIIEQSTGRVVATWRAPLFMVI